ncbi:MAG: hypothetical protein JKP95_00150 [Oceanicaulis sp.]|nr:hypothetical protein [Oceanicaulis sp.]
MLCGRVSARLVRRRLNLNSRGCAQSDNPRWVDVITVTGRSPLSPDATAIPDRVGARVAPDAAGLAARLPGAALVDNGALSGQVQYRGLYGARVAVRLDGQAFHSVDPT